ncbi:hypothetical protein [Nocardia abscessus]|nr:hypothetical protein [Nocardia abscessus]
MTRTCSAQRQAELERAQSVLVAAQAMAREVQIRIHDTTSGRRRHGPG